MMNILTGSVSNMLFLSMSFAVLYWACQFYATIATTEKRKKNIEGLRNIFGTLQTTFLILWLFW